MDGGDGGNGGGDRQGIRDPRLKVTAARAAKLPGAYGLNLVTAAVVRVLRLRATASLQCFGLGSAATGR